MGEEKDGGKTLIRTGVAHLPLHTGRAPRWLFERMRKLAREIIRIIIDEEGASGVFEKLSDPFWFQAFGCALGFDWHSSGLTTTVCGALKEGFRGLEVETGIFIGGGKGSASRKTPQEIREFCEKMGRDAEPLVYASKMSAKIDNTAVQDGYALYHHTFFFAKSGSWAVVQQGMNEAQCFARRYHWWSDQLKDFVNEPQAAVCAEERKERIVNFVAQESREARDATTLISREHPDRIIKEWKSAERLDLPSRHEVLDCDIDPKRFYRVLETTYQAQAPNFERLLSTPGFGAISLRALRFVSELVY